MLIDVTRRLLAIAALLFGAMVVSGCSGRNALKATPHVDAGKDLPADMLVAPDTTMSTTDLPAANPDLPSAACGNGLLEPGETCDDGNTVAGDECSRLCQIEKPACPLGTACLIVCGDGILHSSETCDDGNTTSGDGCSSTCLTEPGWACSSGLCVPSLGSDGGQALDGGCGDGIISGAEECDDGPENSDTAYPACTLQCRRTYCGDGVVDTLYGEDCDLGSRNGATDSPCLADCKIVIHGW